MRRFLVGVVAAALVAGPGGVAGAGPLFRSTVVCDLDGNGTFGKTSEGLRKGLVELDASGRLRVSTKGGLQPGTTYSCKLTCLGNGAGGPNGTGDPAFLAACGTTNGNGDANFLIPDFRANHSAGGHAADAICLGPLFELVQVSGSAPLDSCRSGFGAGDPG
jgi:hypothetical protein